jgi:hypothetical protein
MAHNGTSRLYIVAISHETNRVDADEYVGLLLLTDGFYKEVHVCINQKRFSVFNKIDQYLRNPFLGKILQNDVHQNVLVMIIVRASQEDRQTSSAVHSSAVHLVALLY